MMVNPLMPRMHASKAENVHFLGPAASSVDAALSTKRFISPVVASFVG
jgi:hypothetical protein